MAHAVGDVQHAAALQSGLRRRAHPFLIRLVDGVERVIPHQPAKFLPRMPRERHHPVRIIGRDEAGAFDPVAGDPAGDGAQQMVHLQLRVFEVGDVDQKIEQAKIIMNENVSGNVDPEELAMRLNISYSWFRRVFKEYTGYAPAKYFQELKLRKAKQMLVGTSQSVKEISFFLGFQSTEYFFSFFKKRTGLTPLEYRSFGREE